MNKAKEILYKHAENNGCKSVLSRNPYLEQMVLNAINEVLTIPNEQLRLYNLVGQSEQLPQIHGLIKCECGKVYDVDVENNCPSCGN